MQQAVIQAYFSAGCGEGKDIGNLEVLADIAVAAGVMPRQCALDFLAGDEFAAEVEQLIAQARASGIRGSPVVIVDGKFKLDGVQTTDTYVQVGGLASLCVRMLMDGCRCSDGWASARRRARRRPQRSLLPLLGRLRTARPRPMGPSRHHCAQPPLPFKFNLQLHTHYFLPSDPSPFRACYIPSDLSPTDIEVTLPPIHLY